MPKRILDFSLSIVVVIFLLPFCVVLYVVSLCGTGGALFFCQTRPGIRGQPFTMVKLRTMTDERDSHGKLLSDSQRLTRYGRFLRSTSLDELPELWNVLKGDMSLVGPRPLLMEYLPLYSDRQARRHEVRPGITGWAQVNGRNALSWEEKFELDVWYVENRTLWLDIKILFLTVWKVVKRDGISQEGEVTMSKFTGSATRD